MSEIITLRVWMPNEKVATAVWHLCETHGLLVTRDRFCDVSTSIHPGFGGFLITVPRVLAGTFRESCGSVGATVMSG